MNSTQWIFVSASALVGVGMWLMLPSPGAAAERRRWLGVLLAAIGLGLFGSVCSPLGAWVADSVFGILAVVTIVSAAGAVTMRSPVYCAIWFGLSLLGTAGLFLCQGAQFLGVATVVVYAGAILVTFLFVLMLAQPEGHSFYDRLSWDPLLSAATGALLVGILTMTLTSVLKANAEESSSWPATKVTEAQRDAEILSGDHVARLGAELFSRHLISVEVAGTLLLVALVGTVAVVAQSKPKRRRGEPLHG